MSSFLSDPSRVPYEFTPFIEAVVVRYCITSLDFWGRLGQYLVGDLLGVEPARLAVRVVHELAKEGAHPAKRGEGGLVRVIQRAQRWCVEAGRLKHEDVAALYDYLTSPVEDMSVEAAVREVAPNVRRHLRQQLTASANRVVMPGEAEQTQKAQDETQRLLDAIEAIGKPKQRHGGIRLADADPYEAIRLVRLPRMPFGIPELDALMGGGPQKGTFGFISAYSGYGKSTFMNHWAGTVARQLGFVIYLTGEVVRGRQFLRALSDLSGVPLKAMEADDKWVEEAQLRRQWLVDNHQLGIYDIKQFTATVATGNELFEYVQEVEAEVGRRADLVIVDADEHVNFTGTRIPDEALVASRKSSGESNTYEGFGRLYGYFDWEAKGGQEDPSANPELARVVGTCSQVKGEPNPAKFKILVGEESADSKRKIRIASFHASINWHPHAKGNVFFNGKGRFDEAGSSTPPIPRYFECAQMVRRQDPYPWVQDPQGWRRRQGSFWG